MLRRLSVTLSIMLLLGAVATSDALAIQRSSALSDDTRFLPKDQRVCSFIKENIRSGGDVKSVVKTSIQMGYNACLVVKCAIEGGGNAQAAVSGAVLAGAATDVASRCALDAGAYVGDVVRGLRDVSSICYAQPLGYSTPDGPPPGPIPPPPPPNPPHISPYRP